jgi:hypothetical protein
MPIRIGVVSDQGQTGELCTVKEAEADLDRACLN